MNIKKSIRIIFRNKIYSLLNIAGLAIGITAAALIFLWVESKISFNKAIPDSKDIFIAGIHHEKNSGEYYTYLETNTALAKIVEEEFPEVRYCTRYQAAKKIFTPENTTYSYEEKGAYADSSLFKMIDMKFLKGANTAMFEPVNPIIISLTMAHKIYGTENPLGKGLINEGKLYEVTGIFEDLPGNISFQFEWLIPFRILEQEMSNQFSVYEWGTSWLETYIKLIPNTDINQLNEKMKILPLQKGGQGYEQSYNFLYPINRILLYGKFKNGVETGEGYIKTVRLFFLIGILILLIACINFMNLSTARSQKRSLEVGVRKTFGTKRKHLIRQFLLESGLITFIALLLSIVLIWLTLPLFNTLIDIKLIFDLRDPVVVIGLISIGIFCTLTAGSYPALYLSSFNPVTTLKMQKISKKGAPAYIRQGLVIFQFTIAFILICTTYVIFLQIRLAQNRNIGIEKEHLVVFPVTNELLNSYSAVLNELKNSGVVKNSGLSSNPLLYADLKTGPWLWNGKDPNDDISISVIFISEGLIGAAGIQLIDGTDINPSKKDSEGRRGVIINETLAKRMGEEGRIGGKLGQTEKNKQEITGIIKNFIFDDPYAIEPDPAIFLYNPSRASELFVQLKPEINKQEAIGHIQSILQTFTPNHTFEPKLMTDRFKQMFEEENLIEKLATLFAILAIFISCLGLLGLSAFSAEQKTKEIGIRKVLGANTINILTLLGRNYIILLFISFVIGIPVSMYLSHYYLRDYSYRIILSWDIFIGVALFISLIALLTVSFQTLRAAVSNPIKSIKTE